MITCFSWSIYLVDWFSSSNQVNKDAENKKVSVNVLSVCSACLSLRNAYFYVCLRGTVLKATSELLCGFLASLTAELHTIHVPRLLAKVYEAIDTTLDLEWYSC